MTKRRQNECIELLMQWFSRLDIDINYDYLIEKFCSYEAKEKHAVPYIDSDY